MIYNVAIVLWLKIVLWVIGVLIAIPIALFLWFVIGMSIAQRKYKEGKGDNPWG